MTTTDVEATPAWFGMSRSELIEAVSAAGRSNRYIGQWDIWQLRAAFEASLEGEVAA